MSNYSGRVAVITGAGSGIGRELAIQLAGQEARLVLLDADGPAAAAAAAQCDRAGAEARAERADVTDRSILARIAASTAADLGHVDLLFCAAGVIHTGDLLSSDPEDVDRVIAVNLTGTINTMRAFLPGLIASGRGRAVTFSSGFGLITAPRYTAYCASKFAVRGLSGALQQEMAAAGHPVTVTCVYPGAVKTPIVRSGTFAAGVDATAVSRGFDQMARTTPSAAAAVILRGAGRGRSEVFTGADARAAALVARAAGGAYPRLAAQLIRARRLGGLSFLPGLHRSRPPTR